MAIRNDITVRWDLDPRLIIIDASSLEIKMQDLIDTLRTIEATPEAIDKPDILKSSGKEDLGGGTTVGLTVELQNAKIYFEERSWILTSGTCKTSDSIGEYLYDSSASFLTDEIEVGFIIQNDNTNAVATILQVVDNSTLYSLPLSNGSNEVWTIGDEYHVLPNELCATTGGNLVAVDASLNAMYPILQSPNVQSTLTSSSSATATDLADLANFVWEKDITGYTDPSTAGYTLWNNVKRTVNKIIPFLFST